MTRTRPLVALGALAATVVATNAHAGIDQHCPSPSCGQSFGQPFDDIGLLQHTVHAHTRHQSEKGDRHARVGIVTTSFHAPEPAVWLLYHLTHAGVDHIFLNVEAGAQEFPRALGRLGAELRNRVTLWTADAGGNATGEHSYFAQMHRQAAGASRAMLAAKRLGLDWLFHIDDDELLYSPRGVPVGGAIQLLQLAGNIDMIGVPNAEAVYEPRHAYEPRGRSGCFNAAEVFNRNHYRFTSYANGKAAGRVAAGPRALKACGVHVWTYAHMRARCDAARLKARGFDCMRGVPAKKLALGRPSQRKEGLPDLMLLHFESCTVDRWIEKFSRERDISEENLKRIPFAYYKESIRRVKACTRRSGDTAVPDEAAPGCNRTALAQVWAKWRTTANPQLEPEYLLPINIPWAQIHQAL